MSDSISIYVGRYADRDAATVDIHAVRNIYTEDVVRVYDAAVVAKDSAGRVHVHAAEAGVAVGALVSLLFPPVMIATAVGGEAAAGFIAHLWRGMTRGDLKDLGEALDGGAASLVVISTTDFVQEVAATLNGDSYEIMTLDLGDRESFERELEILAAG